MLIGIHISARLPQLLAAGEDVVGALGDDVGGGDNGVGDVVGHQGSEAVREVAVASVAAHDEGLDVVRYLLGEQGHNLLLVGHVLTACGYGYVLSLVALEKVLAAPLLLYCYSYRGDDAVGVGVVTIGGEAAGAAVLQRGGHIHADDSGGVLNSSHEAHVLGCF